MPSEPILIVIITGIAGAVSTILTKVKCYFNINPCICEYPYIPIDQYEVIHAVEPSIDTQKQEVICL